MLKIIKSNYLNKFKDFSKNYSWLILLLLALCIGAFLRFYNLYDWCSLDIDQGRDLLISWKIIAQKDLTALGPPLSIFQKVFLGPFYYYLMAFWLWLFDFSPMAASFLTAFFNLAVLVLVYFFVRELFNKNVAVLSVVFYSFSTYAVFFSRFIWNPNILPFFALLVFYSFYLWYKSKRVIFFYVFIVSLAIVLQLHLVSIFIIPILVLLFILLRPNKLALKHYFFAFLIFLFFFSPLIYYELNNNFVMLKEIIEFIRQGKEISFFMMLRKNLDMFLSYIYYISFFRSIALPFLKETNLFNLLHFLFTLFLFFFATIYIVKQSQKKHLGALIISSWWLLGILQYILFSELRSPHYLHYMLPVFYILPATILVKWFKHCFFRWLALGCLIFYVFVNLYMVWPRINIKSDYGLRTMIKIAKFIDTQFQNEKYNIYVPRPLLDAIRPYSYALKDYVLPDIGWRYIFSIYGRNYDLGAENQVIIFGPFTSYKSWIKKNQFTGEQIVLPLDFPSRLKIFKQKNIDK